MNKTLIARAGAAAAVVAALLFGSMTPAQAAGPVASAPSQAVHVPANTGPGGSSSGAEGAGTGNGASGGSAGVCQASSPSSEKSPLLPVTRWSNATSQMHSRVDAGPLGLNVALLQRNTLQNGGMATGNFMWTTGAQLASFAIDFCILGSAGGAADNIGATIGNSLMRPENGLLAGLVFVGVIGLLFAGHRRGSFLWKPIAMKAVIVACFIFMVVAAGNTHGGGFKRNGVVESGPYVPGAGSPGWIVTTMNNTVASLASGPAAALAIDTPPTAADGNSSATNCDNYVSQLKQEFRNSYDSGTGKMSAGVPLILSGMWESTGLKSWRSAQFGSAAGGDDPFNNRTYCHLLEQNAGTPVSSFAGDPNSVQGIMSRAMRAVGATVPASNDVWHSAAFVTNGDNVQQDRSLIAWAACRLTGGDPTQAGSWNTAGFNAGDKDHKATPDDCVKFFNLAPSDPLGNFDWSDNGGDVAKRTITSDQGAGAAVNTFIQTLHGNENSGGLMAIFAYNISALGMLIVFGAMALAIIVAKTAMVVMIVILFFMMLQALMPGSDMSKIGGAIKTLLGMNLFVFCIQLIFAFITVFTKLLQDVGTGMLGGESNLIGILWSGLAPLAAVGILHMMFTKVMKIPSPFSLSGGLSWGNAMGAAAGGAAFAGMSNLLERGQNRMKSRATGSVKGAGQSVLNVAAGRRPVAAGAAGRRNAAAPSGEQASKDILAGANVEAARRAAKGGGMAPGATANEAPVDDAQAAENMDATATDTSAAPAAPAAGAGAAAGAVAGVVAGKMDHTLLSTSRVANSQLHKGIKNGAERKVVKDMQAAEAEAAIAAKKARDAAMGVSKRTRTQKAMDNAYSAWNGLRQNPVAFTRDAAGTGAKKAAVNGALAVGLLATTGVAAPVIYAGIKVGQHKYREHKKNVAKTDSAVVQYRAETEKAKMRKPSARKAAAADQAAGGAAQAEQNAQQHVVPDAPESNQRPTQAPNTAPMEKVTVSPIAQHQPATSVPDAPTAGRPERASR